MKGNYNISTFVAVPSGSRISGFGGPLFANLAQGYPTFNCLSGTTNVQFRGLNFVGLYANRNKDTSLGIKMTGVANIIVDNCEFRGLFCGIQGNTMQVDCDIRNCRFFACSATGVIMKRPHSVRLINNSVYGSRAGIGDGQATLVGIWCTDASGFGGSNVLIQGNFVTNTFNEGIISKAAYTKIIGNTVGGAATGTGASYGIIVEGLPNDFSLANQAGWHSIVSRNSVIDCEGGIAVRWDPANPGCEVHDAIISENVITNVTHKSGVTIVGPPGNAITGIQVLNNNISSVRGNYMDAITGRNLVESRIAGNLIRNVSRHGISLLESAAGISRDLDVSGNHVVGAGAAPILWNYRGAVGSGPEFPSKKNYNGLFASSHTRLTVASTSIPSTLYSVTIPGGAIGSNGTVRASALLTGHGPDPITATLKYFYGMTEVAQFVANPGGTNQVALWQGTLMNRNSYAKQISYADRTSAVSGGTGLLMNSAFNTGTNFTFSVQLTPGTNAQTNTLEAIDIEIVYGE